MWCLLREQVLPLFCVCAWLSTTAGFFIIYASALSLILDAWSCVFLKARSNPFAFHLALDRSKLSTLFVLSKLLISSEVVVHRLYIVLQEMFVAVRRKWMKKTWMCAKKTCFGLFVCCFSHLKIYNSAREGSFVFQKSKWIAHSATRFREKNTFVSLVQVPQKKVWSGKINGKILRSVRKTNKRERISWIIQRVANM